MDLLIKIGIIYLTVKIFVKAKYLRILARAWVASGKLPAKKSSLEHAK